MILNLFKNFRFSTWLGALILTAGVFVNTDAFAAIYGGTTSQNYATFSASGSWVVPSGVKLAYVQTCSGASGGGGAATGSTGQGGSGASGNYLGSQIIVNEGETATITVGLGGSAGNNGGGGGTAGGTGGASSFSVPSNTLVITSGAQTGVGGAASSTTHGTRATSSGNGKNGFAGAGAGIAQGGQGTVNGCTNKGGNGGRGAGGVSAPTAGGDGSVLIIW